MEDEDYTRVTQLEEEQEHGLLAHWTRTIYGGGDDPFSECCRC